jgi:hypothetical protein
LKAKCWYILQRIKANIYSLLIYIYIYIYIERERERERERFFVGKWLLSSFNHGGGGGGGGGERIASSFPSKNAIN